MISEEILQKAAAKSCEEFVAAITAGFDPEDQHIFSPDFERKMKKLIRRANHPRFYRTMQRVASIILAAALACGAWLAVDAEARAAFIGWVKETYETFFVYRYEGVDVDTAPARYHLTWVPDGYQEVFSDFSDKEGTAVYSNEAGQFLQFGYVSDPDNSNVFIGTGGAVHYEVTVNGYRADFFASADPEFSSGIAWTDKSNCAFYVSGFLTEKELIKISESIEKIKEK